MEHGDGSEPESRSEGQTARETRGGSGEGWNGEIEEEVRVGSGREKRSVIVWGGPGPARGVTFTAARDPGGGAGVPGAAGGWASPRRINAEYLS
jgi:hypothetical protein